MSYCVECGRGLDVWRGEIRTTLCPVCVKYPGTDTPCMFCGKTFDEHRFSGPPVRTPCGLLKRNFMPSDEVAEPLKRKPGDRLRRWDRENALYEEALNDILDEFDARLYAIEERIERSQKRISEIDRRTVGSIRIGGRR